MPFGEEGDEWKDFFVVDDGRTNCHVAQFQRAQVRPMVSGEQDAGVYRFWALR